MTKSRPTTQCLGADPDGRLRIESRTITIANSAVRPSSSAPSAMWSWPGISPTIETQTAISSVSTVASARSGRPSPARIRSMLIETATNTSPASAAPAPAAATNRSVHSEAS